MKAVRLHELDGPGGLPYEDVADPEPGPGEIAVKLHNAALNRRDVEGMLANYGEDAVLVDHRVVAFGTFTGHAELRELYGGLVGSAASFREDVRVLATGGGLVVAHCDVTARLARLIDLSRLAGWNHR